MFGGAIIVHPWNHLMCKSNIYSVFNVDSTWNAKDLLFELIENKLVVVENYIGYWTNGIIIASAIDIKYSE